MATASVPTDPDAPMNIPLALVEPTPIYVIMYFSEIQELSSNDTREMIIMYNGRHWQGPIIPRYLTTTESAFLYVEVGPNKNGEYIFSLQKSANSTLPPLLSAMEVFLPNSLTEQETDKKEVDAMMNIKLEYRLNNRNWQGDPCAPQEYMWDGVNCSYGPPRIISLNLTASDLAGEILDSISHLTNLELLDLSNNSLNGSVPEFLASMHTLKLINLSRNNLNGSIPTSLLDKAKRGSVLLSLDGNLMLCSSASCANTNNKKKIILAASVAASLALIILIAAATLFFLKRKRRAKLGRRPSLDDNSLQESSSPGSLFTYDDLAKATGDFSDLNFIGQGGFGYVHRGVLPEVAIKQLKAASVQGEPEFRAEIEIISRVHHRHLVSLIGYCITESRRLLVYEFVPNKTLEFHLHEKGRPVMEWPKRLKVALGAARALSYLHEDCNPKTIHRDVKAANVLIDDIYEPKLADFGLARCCLDTDTHVSTRIMGTCGYLAPEYASSGKLTDKSDVFSFGVMLLEMITGRRPVDKSEPFADDESIVDWAKPLMTQALSNEKFDGLVDPRLEHNFSFNEMKKMIGCAAASVRHSAKKRPKMSQIVRALEGTTCSLDENSTEYKEDFKRMALENQPFGTSVLTSDSGQSSSGHHPMLTLGNQ